MEIEVLKEKLQRIKAMGFILSLRRGNTGIGYTLETLLEVRENNIKSPDLGTIELKSKRKNVGTYVTMFTFNSGAWIMSQKDTISNYGYKDKQNRQALKCFVSTEPNNQGLYVKVENDNLRMYHTDGTLIAEWKANDLVQYLMLRRGIFPLTWLLLLCSTVSSFLS